MGSLAGFMAFLQILLIDVSLAGDNAIAVGMAAAGLPAAKRRQAVLLGLLAAMILRILFAIFAMQLLHIPGLMAVGGLLLIWVSWKMAHDLRESDREAKAKKHLPSSLPKTLTSALIQIAIADVSMSLDNILAVAGAAQGNIVALVAGLILSVVLMGAAATIVVRLIGRYPWIAYLGLAVILWTAFRMLFEGGQDILLFFK